MEPWWGWIAGNWLPFLQGIGIVGGLAFTGYSFRYNTRVHRAQTLINITQQHRAIWLKAFDVPQLRRVLSPAPLKNRTITFEERLFVNLIVLHLSSILFAVREGVFDLPAGTDADLQELFSLPIPRKVWEELKPFQDKETVRYVDTLLTNARATIKR